MRVLAKIIGNGYFAVAVLAGVGIWFLVLSIFNNTLGANPVETLLHRSGEIAIWTLGAVLSLSPLRTLFPGSAIIAALNRHRRKIGVTACLYGLIHFACHVLYEGDVESIRRSFAKPFVLIGLAGLSVLIILALTSNNRSMRLLGGRTWKHLHRLAYVAAGLLIYHQSIAGKGHWLIARWLLFPLLALQAARVLKLIWIKWTARASRDHRLSQIEPEFSAL